MEVSQEARDEIIDVEHLRLLSIGHYIAGGLYIAFASIFIFHFVLALLGAMNPEFFSAPGQAPNTVPPDGVMKVFAVIIALFILAGWTIGGLTIYAGRCIHRRFRRTFTLVMGFLNLLLIPFGTLLGISSLIVLSRKSVKRRYGL